jgi:hypothetical protein
MTTGAIIAIVVVVLIVLAVLAIAMPRMRARARIQKRERELGERRERVATQERQEADVRGRQAAEAEQRARLAAREAQAERAQAELHQERAGLHERGMADDELVEDHEREHFDGVMNTNRQDGLTTNGNVADGTPDGDYDRGRRDEAAAEDRPARFRRDGQPADETETETARSRDARL